jgi:catechol 2,3-dioxygenase
VSGVESPVTSVRFRVADREAQREFYEQVLGMASREETDGALALGLGEARVELAHDPETRPRPRPSIGLFHVAFQLPDRRSLAEALAHLDERDVAVDGMADHGVSEAVYLSDREGNGIELYHDRPREAWPRDGDMVAMGTDPLDVRDLLAEARQPTPPPAETTIGHVHLHVPELDRAERFFSAGLGLRVRQRDFPGALFLARGDDHHHVGVNTWAHGNRAPADAVGLETYTWRTEDVDGAARRFADLGAEVDQRGDEVVVEDPAGLGLRLKPT